MPRYNTPRPILTQYSVGSACMELRLVTVVPSSHVLIPMYKYVYRPALAIDATLTNTRERY